MIDEERSAMSTSHESNAISPRQRAIDAYDRTRERTLDTLSETPLMILAGGLAAGALLAALLPRTATETRVVRPTAERVKDSARAAVEAARETSKQRFAEMGLTREKGQETLNSLFDGLKDTARASATAAADAVRNQG